MPSRHFRNDCAGLIGFRDYLALDLIAPPPPTANTGANINAAASLRSVNYMVNHICEPIQSRRATSSGSDQTLQDGDRAPLTVQRCTVHKHRNLFAHAPERLHDEITADYNDMIYASTRQEIEARRKAFIRKWRLKHRAVADSLEEAGDRLFTFTRLPPSQWRSARTTNAIERLHEEFKRRIKTQTVLPSADTAAMLFWALLASGQINMRKVDGWQTLATKLIDQPIDLAA